MLSVSEEKLEKTITEVDETRWRVRPKRKKECKSKRIFQGEWGYFNFKKAKSGLEIGVDRK